MYFFLQNIITNRQKTNIIKQSFKFMIDIANNILNIYILDKTACIKVFEIIDFTSSSSHTLFTISPEFFKCSILKGRLNM